MATDEQAIDQDASPEMEMDEASILSSLARLQEIHISLRSLRGTIPKVMDSILVDPSSPDLLHSNFSQAANGAAQAILRFTQLVEDSRSKTVMDKAKESMGKNPEGIAGWKVTEHEDWLDVKGDGKDDVDEEEKGIAEVGDGTSMEGTEAALDKFRSVHADIEASFDESSRTVTLNLPSPSHFNFQIRLHDPSEGHETYGVDSKQKSKLHEAILEVIRTRPRPNDLDHLLEMLASYGDIKSRPCVGCTRLFDRNAQFPIIRSRKKIKQPDGHFASQWLALHKACT